MEETQIMSSYDYGKEIQIGGARVRILRREDSEAQGRFRGFVKTVTWSLKLLQDITTDPRGAVLFAETLIDIVHRHDPFQTPETKAGVIFETEETDSGVGLTIQNINKITVRQIVENMARMSQSSKSPLELEVPNITVRITYLNPPTGSGKRAFTTGDILELTDFKRKKVTDITDEGDEVSKQRRSNIMLNEVYARSLKFKKQ
ncbi:hypothetical protein B9Z55_028261 [Caenorhabditis nigoni]|uniref:Uncharacterized protein n=1 Tax=Caenorhabditis nigoni TaxID=1611254 RepID=A0A2G5SCG6_9PELO|nr:hypothetical protein B9Z55_028261 [Caenorhabditis nigoni]